MNRRPARGFTLTELLMALAVVGVFSLIATRLFWSASGIFHQTQAAHTRLSASESAFAALQKDVWSASKIDLPDPTHARLSFGDGSTITWSLTATGAVTREQSAAPDRRWTGMTPHLTFGQETATLVVKDSSPDAAHALRFTSQVIQGGGSQ